MSFNILNLGDTLKGSLGKLAGKFAPNPDSLFGRALSRMREAKVEGKGMKAFFAKAKVFLTSMVTELMVPQKAEKAASKEASDKGAEITEKFKRVNEAVKELDGYKDGSSKEAWSAISKIAAVAGGGTVENLTFTETMNIGAFGLNELSRMKDDAVKQGGQGKKGEEAMAGMLADIEKSSAQTKLPLDKVVSTSALALMKPSGKPGSKEYEDNKKDFGIKLLTRLQVPSGEGEWVEAADLLPQIGEKDMKNGDKVVSFVSEHILKNTSDANTKEALEIIAELVNDNLSKEAKHSKLARFAFLIDDRDYKRLRPLLLGGSK